VSYAWHQEETSRALHDLIRTPRVLGDDAPVVVVLACRDQAINALRERLTHLGAGNEPITGQPAFTMGALAQRPLQCLSRILTTMPHPPITIAAPPSDLLPGPTAAAAGTVADRWRCVARNLLLGTAELTRADHQPWVVQPAAGWHLAGDAASTIEALVVLDGTLLAAGVLDGGSERTRLVHRLVAEHVAKLAGWFGTDHTADLATAGVRHELGVGGSPPVTLVRRAQDYARAQRTLTAVLQGQASLLRPGSDQRPGLPAARALATGQIRLATTFARWADTANQPALAEQFRSRIPGWRALHVSTTRLAVVEKRRSPLLLAQQSEMVIGLRSPFPGRLSERELHDLNAATHELTVTAGRTLRREALQAHNIVALDTEAIALPKAQPMTSTEWAFTSACQRLADAQPPLEPPERPATGHAREQLRTALEETLVGNPPPIRRMRPSPVRGPKPPGAEVSSSRRPSL
jgi:hypothetical protein